MPTTSVARSTAKVEVRERKQRTRNLWIGVAAFAGIVFSLGSIVRSQFNSRGTLNPLPYEYMGRVTAEETTKLLGGHGRVAVWRLRIDNKFNGPVESAVGAFKKELGKTHQLTIVASEEDKLRTTGDLPIIMNAPSSERFLELVQRYQDADVLVLFGSVPTLDNKQIAELPQRRPRIVMASIFQMPQRILLEQDVAQVVIAPRDHPQGNDVFHSAEEWFDCMYVVVTPETATTLRR